MGAGNTPFDPQALAALYTRMFQMSNMNPAMMGGMGAMNPMLAAGMGNAAGFGGGMRPGMGMGMGMCGMGGGPGMGGMGRGAGSGQGMVTGGGMNPNVPRGPRNTGGGPPGAGMVPAGVGPQRTGQRGQHNFHPYAR